MAASRLKRTVQHAKVVECDSTATETRFTIECDTTTGEKGAPMQQNMNQQHRLIINTAGSFRSVSPLSPQADEVVGLLSSPADRPLAIERLKEHFLHAAEAQDECGTPTLVRTVSHAAGTWSSYPTAPRTAPPLRRFQRTAPAGSAVRRVLSAAPFRKEETVSPRTRVANFVLPPLSMGMPNMAPQPPVFAPAHRMVVPQIEPETRQHRAEGSMQLLGGALAIMLGRVATRLNSAACARVATTCRRLRDVVEDARQSRSLPPALPRLPHCDLQGPEGLARIPILSTVLCTVLGPGGLLRTMGSGVLVRDGEGTLVVITAAHVMKSPKGIFDASRDPECAILVAMTTSVTQGPRHAFRATTRPELVDTAQDIAVLTIVEAVETIPERGISSAAGGIVPRIEVITRAQAGESLAALHALELGDPSSVHLTDRLMIYGYPRTGLDTITAAEGKCCGFVANLDGHTTHIQMHAQIDNGFSGGPVVSMRDGKVVGIMSYSRGKVDYAISISAVQKLLVSLVRSDAHR